MRLILGAGVLAAVAACGKKGPPKRADGTTGMKVDAKKLKKTKPNSSMIGQ
ncbi:MAG: hypothetical protein OSB58_13005 [Alphaproteobacteria bacterium]|nr:hypothetical protein [Alphaproteobacteria bacterium]